MKCIVTDELVAHKLFAHQLVAHKLFGHELVAHELAILLTINLAPVSVIAPRSIN